MSTRDRPVTVALAAPAAEPMLVGESPPEMREVNPASWPWLRNLAWVATLGLLLIAARDLLPVYVPLGVMLFGAIVGGLNAFVAVGIILIYRTNRIINFAQAEIGVLGALIMQELMLTFDVPWVLALAAGVTAAAILSGLCELVFVRRFTESPRLLLTVATIGLAQLVVAGQVALVNATDQRRGSLVTPLSAERFDVSGFIFDANAIVALAALPVVAVLIAAFFRTRVGVGVRAAAENRDRAGQLGVPVKRLGTVVWVVCGALAGIAFSLRAPVVGASVGATIGSSTLLLRALSAAVIARMERIGVAIVAAVTLGVVEQALFQTYSGSTVVEVILIGVIAVALIVQRSRADRFADRSSWADVEEVRPTPRELRPLRAVRLGRALLLVAGGAAVAGLPWLVSQGDANLLSLMLIYALVALSLVVLTGWAGQVSLGQFAFVGIGASVGGRLTADFGWDFLFGMAAAGIVGAAAAALLGLAALRVKGFFFAVLTLGLAVVVPAYVLNPDQVSWTVPTGVPGRPLLLSRFDLEPERAFFYFAAFVLAFAVLCVRSLRGSRTGRALIAMRDNERGVSAYGISPGRAKLTAFAIAGFICGVAGALFAAHQHSVDAGAFNPTLSLQVFSMAVIGGLGSVPGAIAGAVYVTSATYFFSDHVALLATGAGLLLVLMFLPGGLGRLLFMGRDVMLRRLAIRKGILVPSLLADQRAEAVEASNAAAERAFEEAMARLSGLRGEAERPGAGEDEAGDRDDDPHNEESRWAHEPMAR